MSGESGGADGRETSRPARGRGASVDGAERQPSMTPAATVASASRSMSRRFISRSFPGCDRSRSSGRIGNAYDPRSLKKTSYRHRGATR
jgi:hypothetical protein